MTVMDDIFEDIRQERARQDAKFGDQLDKNDERWLTVLTEEVGEAARAVQDYYEASTAAGSIAIGQHLRSEVIQIAAVAVHWLEGLEWYRE